MLVLPDAVEEFRTVCMIAPKEEIDGSTRFESKHQLLVKDDGNKELDRAHYVSAPQLSWYAMLRKTRIQMELITDPEMYRLLRNSLGGGICMIICRLSKAINKYIRKLFDHTKSTSYIINLDANKTVCEGDAIPHATIRIHVAQRGALEEYQIFGAERRSIHRVFRLL